MRLSSHLLESVHYLPSQDKELTIYLLCDRLRIHFHCSHMCLHLMVGETFYVYTVVMFGNLTTGSCCYTLLQSCLYLIHRILVASSFNVKSNFNKNQQNSVLWSCLCRLSHTKNIFFIKLLHIIIKINIYEIFIKFDNIDIMFICLLTEITEHNDGPDSSSLLDAIAIRNI